MDNLEKIQDQFADFLVEYNTFSAKGNKSAGTRARKALMEITKLAKDIRKEIQDKKNG